MTAAGVPLGTIRISNDPDVLAREIAKAGKSPEVVLEATCAWYWAADVLQARGPQVHLAHPLGVTGSPAGGSRTAAPKPPPHPPGHQLAGAGPSTRRVGPPLQPQSRWRVATRDRVPFGAYGP
jgi:hypothetical protein